jgi:predicted ATPase
MENIKKTNTPVIEISVTNLTVTDLNEMVSDSLHMKPLDTLSLSELVIEKTKGNPFFSREFLVTLYKQELLKFDYQNANWNWDVTNIAQQNFSDNVVEFMLSNLMVYKSETQTVLRYCACLGNQFYLEDLVGVYGKSKEETKSDLLEPLQEGWIFRKSEETFKFLHDRLQQAAYDSMPEIERIKTHHKLGNSLLSTMNRSKDDSLLFDVVAHLNKCHNIIDHDTEAKQLIQLNITATRKALESSASEPAVYFSNCAQQLTNLIGESKCSYELLYSTKHAVVRANMFARKFEETVEIARELMKLSQNHLHKLKATLLLIQCFNSLSQYDNCYAEMEQVLKDNLELTKGLAIDSEEAIGGWIQQNIPGAIGKLHQNINNLKDLPLRSDESIMLEFSGVLVSGLPSFFLCPSSSRTLFAAVCILLAHIFFDEGICYNTVGCLGPFSMIYTSITSDWKTGYKLSAAAVDLAKDVIKSERLLCQATFFYALFVPTHGTLADQSDIYRKGFLLGVRSGEDIWGAYCCMWYLGTTISYGARLPEAMSVFNATNDYVKKLNSQINSTFITQHHWVLQALTGDMQEYVLEGRIALPVDVALNYPFVRCNTLMARALFNYYCGENTIALSDLRKCDAYLEDLSIFFFYHYHFILKSIVVAEELSKKDLATDDKELLMKDLTDLKDKLVQFNSLFDVYTLAATSLVETEWTIHNADSCKAVIQSYRKTIQLANKYDDHFIAAVATTRLANYLEANDLGEVIVSSYVLEAIKLWDSLGATVKVAQVTKKYAQLLTTVSINTSITNGVTAKAETTMSGGSGSHTMNIPSASAESKTAMKMAAIYSNSDDDKLELSKLFMHMLQIINENSGADRSCLIYKNENTSSSNSSEYQFLAQISVEQSSVEMIEKDINDSHDSLCIQIVNRVMNSRKVVLLSDASTHTDYQSLPYISKHQIKSIMCKPIIYNMEVVGVFYLENSKLVGVFTEQRALILKTIVDVSIQNTQVFTTLNAAYARFLPKPFLQQLNKKSATQVTAGDAVEKKMCVMFSGTYQCCFILYFLTLSQILETLLLLQNK